ncbi:hypothetical protein [Pseudomonas purpurea]|uniref:hypothetical protein n=1 Tax=Pseudomonas purpurea TaxID=3136737 RepID=UPI003264BAF1
MTVQVTAPAKRLALPDPLPPLTVKQAPDNQNLDPLRVDRDEALTAEIPTEGLESTDQFYIDVVGAPGTHPDASYTLGPIPLGGVRPREVNLRASIVALLLKKLVTLSYRIVRGAQEKPSEPLELRVSALEVKVPVARILEAQGNGHGFELDLTSGTRDLTARLDRWPLLAKDQLVWVTLKGKDAEGNDHILALLAPPAGTVSQRWEDLGYHELPIDRGYLAKLGNSTTLIIEQRVACDRVNDADAAVVFADRTYTVKTIAVVKPEITSVKDSAGQDVADNGTTTDTTLTLRGTVELGKKVEIHDGNVWREGTTTGVNWTYEASGLSAKTYAFKARVVGSTAESNTWTVTVQAAQVAPIITGMKDSAGQDVADNGTTTDTTLTLRGTVESGKKVEIHDGNAWREGTTTGINWTYEASGLSAKTYAFKARVVGSTAESNTWTVTVQAAQVAPIITGMKDSAGQDVADNGTTTDTTLTLRGTVESGKKVEIHDGNTWREGTTTGINWTYEASGLSAKTYAFKARVVGSTAESNTWTVTVQAAQVAPIITGMKDSAGQDVADNGTTTDTTLTLRGTVESGKKVEIHDGNAWREGTTTGINWTYEASGLSAKTYAFKARVVDSTAESNTWTVTVETASDGKLAIIQIIDALGNEIYRGGATTFAAATSITLKGTAVPEARVSVFDVFDLIDTQPARKSGRWTMTLSALKQKSYNFAISASGADSPALWPLSIMADGTPIIGLVMDKKGQVIAPYGETYEQVFTLSGQGTANGSIKVHELLGDTSVTVVVNAQGRWEHEVSVASPREYHYVASAPEAGSVKSNLWRVRVVKQP